jgi:hypothetical protein
MTTWSRSRGLFTETLIEMLGDRIAGVRTVGIGQDLLDYDEQEDLARPERSAGSEVGRGDGAPGGSRSSSTACSTRLPASR